MNTHKFKQSILKPYDIRGIAGTEITEIDAYFVGKSFGTYLQRELNRKNCIVGYDGRLTSESFAKEVIKGLVETGVDVFNVGLVATPMVYFAIQYFKKESGLMITASHNPAEYNGFKMLTNEAPVWDQAIQELGKIAESGDFERGEGTVEKLEIKEDYINFIVNSYNKNNKKTLNICFDAGNGATAVTLNEIVSKLPGKHKVLFGDVDGHFPNHPADPSILKYMKTLQKEVVEGHFDFGVAYDGDGDRIGVVDEFGNIYYGDQLLCVFARDYLKKNPGEKILFEVSSSQVLPDDIKKHGGDYVICAPGHSVLKAIMKEQKIGLGGETSGHMFFGEHYNYDDAIYATVKLINILANSEETLGSIRNGFPTYYGTPKIAIKCDDDTKMIVPQEIANRIKAQGRKVVDVRGARVEKADGWWLIRDSSTEPKMTVRCEALSLEGLEECKKEVREQLKLSGFEVDFTKQ